MNRVALYARVSSEIQEKDGTIASQIAILREVALKQGDVVVQEYLDDGYSGDLMVRPALDRLRNDAAKKVFDKVVALSPDRMSRKYVYGVLIAEELRTHGIAIQYLNQKDDGTEEARLLLGMTGLFAEYEKAKIIERSRRGRLFKVRSGQIVTSHAPYGYRYLPRTGDKPGQLVIDDVEAENVRLIYRLCVEKALSIGGIAKELAARGIRPRGRFGAQLYWAKSSLTKILKAETYFGLWHFQKYYSAIPMRTKEGYKRMLRTSRRLRSRQDWIAVPGIPPIVDQELFNRAQEQIKKNRAFSPRNSRHQYLLQGLCLCGECGKTYQGTPNHGKFYYRCNNRRLMAPGPRTCWNGSMQATKLEPAVWSAIRQAIEKPEFLIGEIPGVQSLRKDTVSNHEDQLARIVTQKNAIKASESRFLDAMGQGAISVVQLAEQMTRLRERLSALEGQEAALKSQVVDTSDLIPSVHLFCKKISKGLNILESDFEQRRKFIRMIVDEIRVLPTSCVIKGELPLDAIALGGIADTHSGSYGRNPAWHFELAVAI